MAAQSISASCTLALTPAVLKSIEPPAEGRIKIRDTGQPGLLLQVTSTGSRAWYTDYRDRDGKRVSFRIGTSRTHSLTEARAACRQVLGEVAGGRDPQARKRESRQEQVKAKAEEQRAATRLLGAFLEQVYEPHHLAHRKTGDKSAQAIRSVFKGFLQRDMASLTVAEFERFNAARAKAGIKPATLNRDRVRLMALLNHAVDRGLLEANPLSRWKKIKAADDKRIRWLGEQEGEAERFAAALQQAPDDIKAIVTVALHSGMRAGEIFALTWADVDLRRRALTVRAQNSKTGKGRGIPINTTLYACLTAWRGAVAQMPGMLVFPSAKGTKRTDIKKAWASLCRQAQVEDFRLHDCRHTFASRLAMAGTPLLDIGNLLGHASTQMSARYAHLAPDHGRAAVEALA